MHKKQAHARILAPILAACLAVLAGCGGSGSGPSSGGGMAQTYSVGGSVTGLASGESVGLLDNGGDALTVSANGAFTFGTALATGSNYAITVSTQPAGQTCSVAAGSGMIASANATGALVTCASNGYTIGGTIQGLTSSGLVLAESNVFEVPVPANATSFTMPGTALSGTGYDVTVQSSPPLFSCTVANGAGKVSTANVTNISVSCVPVPESVLHAFSVVYNDDGDSPDGNLIQASDGDFYGMAKNGGSANAGVVFKITAGGAETILHSFAGGTTDGENPMGSLVQASDGDFYGMTQYGGTADNGVVFKITPGGTETVLYSFAGGTTDGAEPQGKLIQASDGVFYGMTTYGGSSGDGTVFKITPAGAETVLHSFAGGATDGAYPQGSLIQATDGNFYGMALVAGSNNDGLVFEITPGGAETVLHSFTGGTTDGARPYGSLIQASDGSFYGMTILGGASNDGVVFEISPAGAVTVLHSFTGATTDGGSPYGSLIQAADGNFYGMTYKGGSSEFGVVFNITPAGAESVVYSFGGGTADGGLPTGDLIQASDGHFYGMTAEGGSDSEGTVFVLR